MTKDYEYRIADIAHELPRLEDQMKRIADLLEKLVENMILKDKPE